MTLDKFLTKQLQDFVLVYKNLFKKTFGVATILSFLCLLIIAALHSYFGPETTSIKMSLLSYLWYSFSTDKYNLTDMSKSVLLFVISFYSTALTRKMLHDKENGHAQLSSFFDEIKPKDFGFLFITLAVCLVADYLLHQIRTFVLSGMYSQSLNEWVYSLIHFLRIYIPLLLFSYTNRLILTNRNPGLTIQECLFMLIVLWIFNEMAYEFYLFVKVHLFQLFLISVPDGSKFFAESILAIPLLAFLFPGYHSAMTNSLMILRNNDEPEYIPATEQPVTDDTLQTIQD